MATNSLLPASVNTSPNNISVVQPKKKGKSSKNDPEFIKLAYNYFSEFSFPLSQQSHVLNIHPSDNSSINGTNSLDNCSDNDETKPNILKIPTANPHTIEECMKLTLKNGWTLQGHSRAGERTGFWLSPLNILLDAGLETKKRPNAVLITHKHFDHLYNLPLIGTLDRTGDRGGPPVCISETGKVEKNENKSVLHNDIGHIDYSSSKNCKNSTRDSSIKSLPTKTKLRPTYMPRSAHSASELLFKAVRLISGVHGSKFEDVDNLNVFEIQGTSPQIVKARDKFILGQEVSKNVETDIESSRNSLPNSSCSLPPSNYTDVEVLNAYHGKTDGDDISVGYGFTSVKSKLKEQIIDEWIDNINENDKIRGKVEGENHKDIEKSKTYSVGNKKSKKLNKNVCSVSKKIRGEAIKRIMKLFKDNPNDPKFAAYNHSITERVRVPELAFYCDSQILNLTNHEEWKKYPIVICECTGFPEAHPDPTKVQVNYHTHLNELEIVMREFRFVQSGIQEEDNSDNDRHVDETSRDHTHKHDDESTSRKDVVNVKIIRQWIVIHTSLGASPFSIWKHQKRLREEGIDVTFWIDSI